MRPTRRTLLFGGGGLALAGSAFGFGGTTRVDVGELDLGRGTVQRPNAWKRLLYEVTNTTSVECEPRAVRVTPDTAEMFEHPFCVLQGLYFSRRSSLSLLFGA